MKAAFQAIKAGLLSAVAVALMVSLTGCGDGGKPIVTTSDTSGGSPPGQPDAPPPPPPPPPGGAPK